MAPEPLGGLYRREFLRNGLLIGGLSALYFSSAHAETSPDDQTVVAAVPAAEPLNVATGDFFPSAFVTSPDLLNQDGSSKVGYRVGADILREYQRNRSAWGAVRTQEFDYQGSPAQLFENAFVVEGETGVSQLPVVDLLQAQGLGSWLDEYGFDDSIPVWKTAVASGQFVPAEALVPIGRETDQRIPSQIIKSYKQLTIHNYDPTATWTFDNTPTIDRLMALANGPAQINFHFVSSPAEIPAALGSLSAPEIPKRPRLMNIIGGVSTHEYIIRSPTGDLDYWLDLNVLHGLNLDPRTKDNLAYHLAGEAQAITISLLTKQLPYYQWDSPAIEYKYLSLFQTDQYQSYVDDVRKKVATGGNNDMIIFDVAFCNDSQTCPT